MNLNRKLDVDRSKLLVMSPLLFFSFRAQAQVDLSGECEVLFAPFTFLDAGKLLSANFFTFSRCRLSSEQRHEVSR